MDHMDCDVLVIGSGAAGLRAAIAAAGYGLSVRVLSMGSPGKGTCTIVSGGVMAGTPAGGDTERHLRATLKVGRGLNAAALVRLLVDAAPERLKELIDWGIDGRLAKGHLYAAGRVPVWGEAIVHCLLARATAAGVKFHGKLQVNRLSMKDGSCTALAAGVGEGLTISARAAVLAAGGSAALFKRNDNPKRMIGTGYTLALDAGAALQDMEFVQFYPLGLAEPGFPPFLIPPGIADRGRIFNRKGEDILAKYAIHERPAGDKARDRLSQALFQETEIEREPVFLDVTGATDADWKRDPFSASTAAIFGERYGARKRPLRIAPIAHHVMGGVVINEKAETTVPGLFAAGEVTGGIHGANRMGGNALTDTLVFGAIAGASAARWASGKRRLPDTPVWKPGERAVRRMDRHGETPALVMERIRRILWEDGGIIRNRDGLTHALAAVDQAAEDAPVDETALMNPWWEVRSAARAAALILGAALRREESRGAHFRSDFPETDDRRWKGNLRVERTGDGALDWRFVPVD